MLPDKTCLDTEYYTPERVLEPVREYFDGGIDFDPATAPSNPTKAKFFLTKAENGLVMGWFGNVFVNPPFGRELRAWLARIHEAASNGVHIIALLPGQRFEQAYFQENIFINELDAICFVRKRLAFLGADGKPRPGNPYGSMLYLFNGDPVRFTRVMQPLGHVLVPLK